MTQTGTAVQSWKAFDTQLVEVLEHAKAADLWGDRGGGIESARVVLEIRRACRAAPKLRQCTMESIGRAALDAYTAGLVPDGREGYLIPRWNKHARGHNQGAYEAHFDAAWRGLQALACEGGGGRPGAFQTVTAQVVREHDLTDGVFEWREGADPHLRHEPALNSGGPIVAAYAIGFPSDAGLLNRAVFVVVDRADLDRARKKGGPVWDSNEPAMCRKTAVRRLVDKVLHTPTTRARLAAATRAYDRLAEVADQEAAPSRLAARVQTAKEEAAEPSGPVVDAEVIETAAEKSETGNRVLAEPDPAEVAAAYEGERTPSDEDIEEVRRQHGLFEG